MSGFWISRTAACEYAGKLLEISCASFAQGLAPLVSCCAGGALACGRYPVGAGYDDDGVSPAVIGPRICCFGGRELENDVAVHGMEGLVDGSFCFIFALY